jgi:hypothetical protein
MNQEAIYSLIPAGSASGVLGVVPVGAAPQMSRAIRGDAEATEKAAVIAIIMDVKEGILEC